jgi:hypothetical protein
MLKGEQRKVVDDFSITSVHDSHSGLWSYLVAGVYTQGGLFDTEGKAIAAGVRYVLSKESEKLHV